MNIAARATQPASTVAPCTIHAPCFLYWSSQEHEEAVTEAAEPRPVGCIQSNLPGWWHDPDRTGANLTYRGAMRRVILIGLGLASIGTYACVGDTPVGADSGVAQPGEESGPCYGDGTCNKNQPLTCISKVCVRLTDGGNPNDGGAPIDGGGPPPNCNFGTNAQPGVACGTSARCTTATQNCCSSSSTPTCQPKDAGCSLFLGTCDETSDCQTGVCCLTTGSVTNSSVCPVSVSATIPASATCVATCTGLVMCALGAPCAGGKTCVRATNSLNFFPEFGVCM